MAKGHNDFNEAFFLKKGFVPDGKGGFNPPKFNHSLIDKPVSVAYNLNIEIKDGELVQKQKVNNDPNFEVIPPTEWFIKNYNVPSKKNSRQNFVKNGKQISIPSKNHAEYIKLTAMQYKVFGIEFRAAVTHFKLVYPLYIQFTFIRNAHRRSDFTNMCQTVEDLMVSNNWIEDDDCLHLIPAFAPIEYDKLCPGVKIKLLLK